MLKELNREYAYVVTTHENINFFRDYLKNNYHKYKYGTDKWKISDENIGCYFFPFRFKGNAHSSASLKYYDNVNDYYEISFEEFKSIIGQESITYDVY